MPGTINFHKHPNQKGNIYKVFLKDNKKKLKIKKINRPRISISNPTVTCRVVCCYNNYNKILIIRVCIMNATCCATAPCRATCGATRGEHVSLLAYNRTVLAYLASLVRCR